MAERDSISGLRQDSFRRISSCLAKLICDHLVKESRKENLINKESRHFIFQALTNMEKVYKFRNPEFSDAFRFSLYDIFNFGRHPVPVKNRLSAEIRKRKGNELMHSNLYKLAEEEYTKALELNPYNAIYHCNRAAARIRHSIMQNKSYLDAIRDCDKALELDSTYTKAYVWLGLAYVMMGCPVTAVYCYQTALSIDPGNEISRENMDLINRKINRKTLKPWHTCRRALAGIFNAKAQNRNGESGNSTNKKVKIVPKKNSAKMLFSLADLEEFNFVELD